MISKLLNFMVIDASDFARIAFMHF